MKEASGGEMVALEVRRNGERICLAGIGEYGLVSATVMYLSHDPERIARWEEEGRAKREPITLDLTVGGHAGEGEEAAHWDWAKLPLQLGDEVLIRVVNTSEADPPTRKRRDDPQMYDKHLRQYVRTKAHDLGWKVTPPARRRIPKRRQY